MLRAELTTNLKAFSAVCEGLDVVTRTVKSKVPPELVVPEINPVELFSERPCGRVFEMIVQVPVCVPRVPSSCFE